MILDRIKIRKSNVIFLLNKIKMNIFVFNTSIEVIRVYLEYKNFEKEKINYLLKSIKFIDMDIDKIGFFFKI